MECNKDEAFRAKKIAERKVTERDYAGAKKLALKAQTLYPDLEGITQLLTTIGVYNSAEKRINGEVDWYAVLGTNPWVDDETVRKHYKKLVMVLHPDKNKAVGAEGAFQLVAEAWSLLSDKAKRLAYNEKLNPKFQPRPPIQSGVSFASTSANNIHSSANVTSQAWSHNSTPRTSPASVPSSSTQNPGTFWTICNGCKTQYEYLRIYMNHTLLCPNCHEAFLALERPAPSNAVDSSNLSSRQQHQTSKPHAANSNIHNSGGSTSLNSRNNTSRLQFGIFYRDGKRKEASSSNATQAAASVVHQTHEKSKKECEEAQAALKKRKIHDNRMNGNRGNMGVRIGGGSGIISGLRKGSLEAESSSGIHNKPNSRVELTTFEIRDMLASKALVEIRKHLETLDFVTNSKSNKGKTKMKEKGSSKQKNMDNGDLHDLSEHDGSSEKNRNKESIISGSSDGDSDEHPQIIIVPDSDFHNFDLDRNESSFGDDHVWAAYDDEDGMPRFYAKINEVVSLKPFKVRISWLSSRSNSELGPLEWVGCGFTKTCGDFRVGKQEISETLNSFSHKVKWIKGTRGVLRIFPCKGDVWALYRNWSPDWNENTPDEVIHKYDMVEVLDDYSEEQGVCVTPLVKVDGFKTVFCKHMDPKEVKKIPKEEMFRFSHQVPSCLLTGKEAENAPAGCWELDPAATPLELQSSTEVNEAMSVDNGEKVDDEMLQNAPKTTADEVGASRSKASEGEVECHTSQE